MNKLNFFLIISIFILSSCQNVKDALEGKRKSRAGDEFLIEKKNPLTIPPSFEELPEPVDSSQVAENEIEEQENDLQRIINNSTENNNEQVTSSGSLENLILEKINTD